MRDRITTVLEVTGLVLVDAAAGVAVAAWSLPAGLAVAGVGLIASSALLAALAPAPTKARR